MKGGNGSGVRLIGGDDASFAAETGQEMVLRDVGRVCAQTFREFEPQRWSRYPFRQEKSCSLLRRTLSIDKTYLYLVFSTQSFPSAAPASP